MSEQTQTLQKYSSRPDPTKFRQRVELQSATLTADGEGGFTESWATSETLWARLKPLTAQQKAYAQSLQHRITHVLFLRYTASPTSAMRFKEGTRIYQIQNIINWEELDLFTIVELNEGAPS